jgi:hypothetical protein
MTLSFYEPDYFTICVPLCDQIFLDGIGENMRMREGDP